jgi:hypothetical protein
MYSAESKKYSFFIALSILQSLTLSVRVEYIYSTASHASCPDGVLVLRDFYKVLKWASMLDFKV